MDNYVVRGANSAIYPTSTNNIFPSVKMVVVGGGGTMWQMRYPKSNSILEVPVVTVNYAVSAALHITANL